MADSRRLKPPLAEFEPFLQRTPSQSDINEFTNIIADNHIATTDNEKLNNSNSTPIVDDSNHKIHSRMSYKTDVIGDILGPIGKWQLKAIFLIYLTKIPSSWFMACVIFTAPAPEHGEVYCKPSSDSVAIGPHNKTDWIQVAHPIIEDPHDKEFKFDYCNVYDDAHLHAELFYNDSGVLHHIEPWQKPHKGDNIVPCQTFEYNPGYVSVVTQFDLVCSRDVLIAVTQFFHLFGVLWGGIIATKLMEFISPKRLMLLGMFAQIVSGCLTGLVNNYWLHVFFRCTSAICCGQMYTGGQVIFTDITSGKYKTSAIALFEQFWSIGLILLPGVAYYWSNWTYLYIAISTPTVILIYLYRWIPDSPRWLLKNGMLEETKELLIEAAEFNGTTDRIPKDIEVLLQAEMEREVPPEPSWFSIWENKRTTINLICLHIGWSIYIMVYYAWLLNIRVYGRKYLEVNTVAAAISEMIGVFFGYYVIMCTTRKWMWSSLFNMLAGLVAYTIWFLPPGIKGPERVALQMCTSMIAKMSVSSTLCLLTTCTTELVSPDKRKVLGYWSTVWARFWLLGAPFIGALGYFYGRFVPQTILGTMTFLGGVITSYIDVSRTHPKKCKTNEAKYPAELSPEIFTVKL